MNHDYDAAGGAFRTVLQEVARLAQGARCAAEARLHAVRAEAVPGSAATLTEVTRKYPGTDAARLAAERLKRIPAP